MTTPVPQHYGSTDTVARILAAIPWSPDDGTPLTATQLFPYDQLHGRELLATQDHAARLAPGTGARLLDIGSGIGGPARYLASTFGCHVTGIDLTPEFVAAARDLTDLCGLSDRVTFVQADATKMPFDGGAFDHSCCFYVGMNLPDKPAVLAEAFRVLRPGATLLWTEATIAGGDPHYPLPWSRTPEDSHVQTRDVLVGLFTGAGFTVAAVEDETAAHLELARQMKASGRTLTPGQQQANAVVLGADFAEHRRNYITSLAEGRIASTLIEVRKPL